MSSSSEVVTDLVGALALIAIGVLLIYGLGWFLVAIGCIIALACLVQVASPLWVRAKALSNLWKRADREQHPPGQDGRGDPAD